MKKYPDIANSILVTMILAGTLDLAGAVISSLLTRGIFPVKILKYIAGGVFGSQVLDGGILMHLIGGLFHFFIATCWTVLFYILYPHIKMLHRSIWLNALLYGILVWAVMNLLVLPLSAWKAPIIPFNIKGAARAATIVILCVGLPIAWRVRNFYKGTGPGAALMAK